MTRIPCPYDYPDNCNCDTCKGDRGGSRRSRGGGRRRGNSGGGHQGGWLDAQHGYIGVSPVTFSLGWGTKEGEVLLADGHIDTSTFRQSHNHNHYGKGQGPNANVKDRGLYNGPGA